MGKLFEIEHEGLRFTGFVTLHPDLEIYLYPQAELIDAGEFLDSGLFDEWEAMHRVGTWNETDKHGNTWLVKSLENYAMQQWAEEIDQCLVEAAEEAR